MSLLIPVSEIDTDEGSALFAGGCFWTTEAVFQQLRGVKITTPGYVWMTPGVPGQECPDRATRHRMEVVQIQWDRSVITMDTLVSVHLATICPTLVPWENLNAYSQYRTGIFCENPNDAHAALSRLAGLRTYGNLEGDICTQVLRSPHFEAAGSLDKNVYSQRPHDEFCQSIITPKLLRVKALFPAYCRSPIKPVRPTFINTETSNTTENEKA